MSDIDKISYLFAIPDNTWVVWRNGIPYTSRSYTYLGVSYVMTKLEKFLTWRLSTNMAKRRVQKSRHRRPPKPESWNVSRGWCRFCGAIIMENGIQNRRKHWHPQCVVEWRCMNNPSDMRQYVLVRDKFKCRECETPSPLPSDFEIDHIKPLYEAFGDLSYFSTENAQLLCISCHAEKTKLDVARWRMYFKEQT